MNYVYKGTILMMVIVVGLYFLHKSFCNTDSRNVLIQSIPSQEDLKFDSNDPDDENFYVDYDKCLEQDGKQACLANEQFFGDSYYGVGSENVDSVFTITD